MIDYITSDLFVFWFFLLCLLCLFLIVNMKEFEITFKDLNSGSLFSQDNLSLGNKQTQLNQANRAADARAKVSRLAHLKKIGVKS